MARRENRTRPARRRPWRITCAGGRCLGTFGTPDTAFGRARDLVGRYGRVWVRHRDWATFTESVDATSDVDALTGTALLHAATYRPVQALFPDPEHSKAGGDDGEDEKRTGS